MPFPDSPDTAGALWRQLATLGQQAPKASLEAPNSITDKTDETGFVSFDSSRGCRKIRAAGSRPAWIPCLSGDRG
jgi:hypothetical protein